MKKIVKPLFIALVLLFLYAAYSFLDERSYILVLLHILLRQC